MHLKRLEAFGFKSFADRMEFDFDHGVTGIVGPNGCGKSNVVDAVKWALGEQRPTSIRGTEMADVLFAGAAGRKPLGLAEVSLTFDNGDRFLALDLDEVVLTRRLYRDGTSEYLLNRESARLKDIRELFLDTGGGRGALAILEQGKIDAVLQENPLERRLVFEEAAGIARYRLRQRETMRKVEHLDENLSRLRDVLSVTEKQLRGIRSQAGRAEKWRALEQELRARRIELGLHRYATLLKERAEAAARVEDLAAREAEANGRLAALSGDLQAAEQRVHEARDRAASLEAEAGKAEGAAEAAMERATAEDRLAGELEGRIRWYEGEIEVTVRRLEEARVQAEQAAAAETEAGAEEDDRRGALGAAEATIAAALAEWRERSDAVRVLRTRALELLERRGRLANARARVAAEEGSLAARGERLGARRETLATDRARAGESHGESSAQAHTAAEEAAAARSALAEDEEKAHGLEKHLADLRTRLTALDRAVSAARSRLDVLTSLRDRHEGLGRGARRILEEAAKVGGGLGGVRGVLGDLLDTEVADAESVELALGAAAEAIVVETFEDARRAITLLKEEGIGRALFLPLDSLVPLAANGEPVVSDGVPVESPGEEATPSTDGVPDPAAPDGVPGATESAPGVIDAAVARALPASAGRAASAAVRCSDDLRALVEAVLAGTILVENLDGGRVATRTVPGVLRAVTGGGEVLDRAGGISGGRGDGSGHGMLARNAEIRTLRTRLAGEERRLSALQGETRTTESALAASRASVASRRTEVREKEHLAGDARSRMERHAAELRRADGELGNLETELAEIASERERCIGEARSLDDRAAAAAEEEAALGIEQDAAHASEASAEAARRAAEEQRSEVRIALARAVERRAAARMRREAAVRTLTDGERNLKLARVELENCGSRRAESLRAGSTARAEAEQARARREKAVRDLGRARETVAESTRVLDDLRRGVSEVDDEYRSYRGTLESFRLRENESRMRIENLLQRMREEVRIDLDALHNERVAAAEVAVDGVDVDAGAAAGEDAPTVGGVVSAAEGDGATPSVERIAPAAPSEPLDEAAAEQTIEDLRIRMERMGNVNLEALDQLGDIEKQATDLREQEKDLTRAREELMEALRLLNRESRDRFTETFERIRIHFQETFRKLFGGGKADIFLAEGEDVLESGVEVVARPPGKELRSISLLSGGERTMTAVALLFAVYKARPSPFCILDEVDAALDETNIGRFVHMLRDFLDTSQFIIITHNKKTMTIADRLYGISMAEPGVSTRVMLQLDQIAEKEAVEVA